MQEVSTTLRLGMSWNNKVSILSRLVIAQEYVCSNVRFCIWQAGFHAIVLREGR
ncbi:hypothetical protein [Segetibacter sp. 3557_3]|uniref:hypothetical protein n=1 Tax=Segetibacter sp. 3557_3 TaxID=2547429 RepID=UPI001404E64F|nr:hypothetical protein [Segetibacter sp. 3557_3]